CGGTTAARCRTACCCAACRGSACTSRSMRCVSLGSVAQVEELGADAERTGSYGDYGFAMAAAAPLAASAADDFEAIDGASRVRRLRFRVRFLIS
ncbi:hypothetical protein ACEN8K_38370, partial [Variovorax sp. CT11-76]